MCKLNPLKMHREQAKITSIKFNTEGQFFSIESGNRRLKLSIWIFIDNHSIHVSFQFLDDKEVCYGFEFKKESGKGKYKSVLYITQCDFE
jgi:hypothetical protein